jgi:hypothetical protein
MSLQNKMYQHEATPPIYIWGRIADALDVMETETIQHKLYNNEVTVPSNVRSNIFFYLDNLQTFKTLRSYEVHPPQLVWHNIEASLDENMAWQRTVYNAEITAPDTVKKNVFNTIDNSKRGKVVSIVSFKKIAAAAALFVTAGLVYYLYNSASSNSSNNIVVNNNVKKEAVLTAIDTVYNNKVVENKNNDVASNDMPNPVSTVKTNTTPNKQFPDSKTVVTKNNRLVKNNNTVGNNIKNARVSTHDLAIIVEGEPTLYVKPGTSITPDITYIGSEGDNVIVTGPSGASFSLSRLLVNKLYLSFNAGNRDEMELLDQRIAEATVWKVKYEKWKKNFEENFFKSGTMGGFIEEAVQATKE